MNVTERIRQHCLDNLGMPRTLEYKHIPDLDELRAMKWNDAFMADVRSCFDTHARYLWDKYSMTIKWDPQFERYMRNRLVLGTFRYRVWEGARTSHDYPMRLRTRLQRFCADGNTEHFVDAANFALVEASVKRLKPTGQLMTATQRTDYGAVANYWAALYQHFPTWEYLTAAAAFAAIAYQLDTHPDRHFGPSDDDHQEAGRPDGSMS